MSKVMLISGANQVATSSLIHSSRAPAATQIPIFIGETLLVFYSLRYLDFKTMSPFQNHKTKYDQ